LDILPSIRVSRSLNQNESICSVLEKSENYVEEKKFQNMKELEHYRLNLLEKIVSAVNIAGKNKEL
jgi:hypothetical protein